MYRYKKKQNRHKPLYKKFLRLRVNVQNKKRLNLLKFKKKKMGTSNIISRKKKKMEKI